MYAILYQEWLEAASGMTQEIASLARSFALSKADFGWINIRQIPRFAQNELLLAES